MSAPVVLHVSPHPDDELIGAPATLMALRDAGWRVVNLACSLGRADQRARRRAELTEACERAGFELVIADAGLSLGAADDLVAAQAGLASIIGELVAGCVPATVVSPSPVDGHHGHEVVARAVRDALSAVRFDGDWLIWGLWADLPYPTTIVPFTAARLTEIQHALSAHRGELERNDYAALVQTRARMNAILGPERVFGFGAAGLDAQYAEILTRLRLKTEGWRLACAGGLTEPFNPADVPPIDWWLAAPSPRTRLHTP